jgi:VWA domain-containing protein
MTKQRKQGSFNKRRWFIQLTAVVGLVGGLLAIMNGIKPYFEAKPPRRVLQNTEIVFDRSELMNRRLQDGTPKLEVARKAVDLVLRNETVGDNLALRAFGGACADESTQPALPFDLDNAARVREKIQNLKADGRATLIAAIRAAIADFDDEARFGLARCAVEQVRAGLQRPDRHDARPHRAGQTPCRRRRGDRMMGWMAPLRHRRAKLVFRRITRNGSHP